MKQNALLNDYAAITCVTLILAIRYASEYFGWRTRPSEDYSDKVIAPVKRAATATARPVKRVVLNAVDRKVAAYQTQKIPHHEKAAHRVRLRAETKARMLELAAQQSQARLDALHGTRPTNYNPTNRMQTNAYCHDGVRGQTSMQTPQNTSSEHTSASVYTTNAALSSQCTSNASEDKKHVP